MNYIIGLFEHYGYIVLFFALLIELIGFPTPGETLLTYCGFLAFQNKMNPVISIVTATLGVITGITISYFIGCTLGNEFFVRYGKYIGMTPKKFKKASEWFDNYGNMLLLVALFIPGVRHVTGYLSGITKISFKKFAQHAYAGALIWTTTFVCLGRILGSQWDKLHLIAGKYLIIGGIILVIILTAVFLYKNYKSQIQDFIVWNLKKLVKGLHFVRKMRIFTIGIAIIFVGFTIIVIALAGHFFANDFNELNSLTSLVLSQLIPESWQNILKSLQIFTQHWTIILLTFIMLVWIIYKENNKLNKLRFLLVIILGGAILEIAAKVIFNRLEFFDYFMAGTGKYSFPSEQALMSAVLYGFLVYIIKHHLKTQIGINIITSIGLIICFLSGLSPLYFKSQRIIDILVGYALGGIWLSLNLILLESSNALQKEKKINN